MVKTASELHMKMHNLKTKRMNDMQHIKVERVNNADRGFCSLNRGKGNSTHVYVICLIELIFLYGVKIPYLFHEILLFCTAGLYNANLEGIQDCLAELKKMWSSYMLIFLAWIL